MNRIRNWNRRATGVAALLVALLALEATPAFAATIYADSVIGFSSQYEVEHWSATQALGAPDTFSYGDNATAWAAEGGDSTDPEYLILGFSTPIYADSVTIWESWNSGFVTQIELIDTTDVYHTVFSGIDPSPDALTAFKTTFSQTSYAVKGVKVTINPLHVMGDWEEIDAVGLSGKLVNPPVVVPGLRSWGLNGNGQLGNGGKIDANAPTLVVGMDRGVTAASAGLFHGMAVKDGALYVWGDNGIGQLGTGDFRHYTAPTPLSGLSSGVTAVSAGDWHSLAIQNGVVYSWGQNDSGELGIGNRTNSRVPRQVTGLGPNVTAISAGTQFSLAIQNGALYSWGLNSSGQLGVGGTTRRTSPTAVPTLGSGVTQISASDSYALAVKDGAAYAWGINTNGQLGRGNRSNSATPIAIASLSSGVTSISAGLGHALAVMGGQVYAWGNNDSGQLGNGTTVDSLIPILIAAPGMSDIVAVAAGSAASFALSADGSLWVWGYGGYGTLGLGITEDYDTPQHVEPPDGYRYTSIEVSDYGFFAMASLSTIPIPEPATFSLALLAGLPLLLRRNV